MRVLAVTYVSTLGGSHTRLSRTASKYRILRVIAEAVTKFRKASARREDSPHKTSLFCGVTSCGKEKPERTGFQLKYTENKQISINFIKIPILHTLCME